MEERINIDTDFIKALCYRLIDIIEFYELMERTPTCNSCGRIRECEHAPQPGQQVRSNCHMWEEIKED